MFGRLDPKAPLFGRVATIRTSLMKAIVIDEALADRPLRYQDVPEPVCGRSDLLIAVKAAALNRADLRRAATHFAASDKKNSLPIAGVELAGEVAALGADVTGFAVGDRVMAMAGGAYAEQAVIDHRLAIRVPPSMSRSEERRV